MASHRPRVRSTFVQSGGGGGAPPTIGNVVFLPDGDTLATAGRDGAIKLWSVETQTEMHTLRGHLIGVVIARQEGDHLVDVHPPSRRVAGRVIATR